MNRPIFILIFFFLILVLGIGFVWPRYQDLVILEKMIEEKRMEIATKDQNIENLKKTKETLIKNYQAQLAKVNSALPSDPNLATLLDFFQKVSSQQGLVLVEISPFLSRSSEEIEGLKETEFSLILSGDYSSLKNFLSAVEKSARLIEVEKISFLNPEKEGSLDIELKIKVHSY